MPTTLDPTTLKSQGAKFEMGGPYMFVSSPLSNAVNAEDLNIANGDAAGLHVRVYTAPTTTRAAELKPLVLYMHGGGWVMGSVASSDNIARYTAAHADVIVASVDYRLAPKHLFPAATDDCFVALKYMIDNSERFGIDASRVAVMGDSAGGNLAAVTAQRAREAKIPLALQVLVYPVLQVGAFTDSYVRYGEAALLPATKMIAFWRLYAPDHAAAIAPPPTLSPAHAASLAGLPPALVLLAEVDVLRDEGLAYAARLRAEGGAAEVVEFTGAVHGFFGSVGSILGPGKESLDVVAATLRARLAVNPADRRWAPRAQASSGVRFPLDD